MKNRLILMTAVAMLAYPAAAQTPAQTPPAQQAAPQGPKAPQPKSKEELDAIMAIQNAATPDARLAAIDTLLTKFADTEFKPMVLLMAAVTAQQKNDFPKLVIYAERAIEADPKSFGAMILLAQGIAQQTREHDLDRDEKLAKAEKHAKTAIQVLKDLPKQNPNLSDEQWENGKKDQISQAHEALGMTAMVRKKYDDAIAAFKTSVEVAASQDPSTWVRLGAAYNKAGKYDEAIAALDKAVALPEASPVVKQFAAQEKAEAVKNKNTKK